MPYRGYKYRLYPDSEARAYFARCFGATRYCYNYCVRQYDQATAEGRAVSGFDIMAQAREHLNTLDWFSTVDYEIKESAPMRFDKALSKYKRHQANRPREHKKGERPTMSYTTGGTIHVDFKHDLVQLPKIGLVRARLHRPFSGEITSATVKREADGCYYISLCVHSDDVAASEAIYQKPHTDEGTVGIDVGLHHLATLSNGDTIDLPDTSRIDARIALLKARNERQHPGSRRYRRTSLQVSRLQHRLACIRRDAHHKAAASLCARYDTICMETLNVDGMRHDPQTAAGLSFNTQLHRSALALFRERVEQKCADTGTRFVAIDRWEPTTKRCNVCGYTLPTIDLDTREWTCPECHTHHDRDINAAINIRRCGLEKLAASPKQKETLPPAEGNVKPAKKATAGRNLRTGKVTAASARPTRATVSRQPKAQIADGTAPPRFFHREPLPKDHPFRNFKLMPLAVMAGLSDYKVRLILFQSRFADPAPEERDDVIKLLQAIKRVAASLRQMRLTDSDPANVNAALGQMNKVARVDWVLKSAFGFRETFTIWRAKPHDDFMIREINHAATVDFPNKLDAMADKHLMPLLPQPERKPTPKVKPLRRERKNDTMITPTDDPRIISYEEQILDIVKNHFICKQCHIYYDTLKKIMGEGTMFRPQNCTYGRMETFIMAMYRCADILTEIDTGVEGVRPRMDQLYYINEQYIDVTKLVRRYINFDRPYSVYRFTRAGTITPGFYNEHYPEIMSAITRDIPNLIRECADYLADVYHVKC